MVHPGQLPPPPTFAAPTVVWFPSRSCFCSQFQMVLSFQQIEICSKKIMGNFWSCHFLLVGRFVWDPRCFERRKWREYGYLLGRWEIVGCSNDEKSISHGYNTKVMSPKAQLRWKCDWDWWIHGKVSPSKWDFPSRVVGTSKWILFEGNCGDVFNLVAHVDWVFMWRWDDTSSVKK